MAKEASLERSVVDWCEKAGFGCKKLALIGEVGWPDRAIILPNNHLLFTELKAPNGRLSPQQKFWIKQLQKWGHIAIVPRTLQEVQDAVIPFLSNRSQ